MNRDLKYKIQAYLDGELSERESRRVADWLETDPEAGALLGELRMTRRLLVEGGELERHVPETAEFYWSKIQREIDRLEASVPVREGGWFLGWRKYLAPVAGVAMVALMAVGVVKFSGSETGDPYLRHLAEVESPTRSMGSYSFRSQSGNMFVVWLYERTPEVLEESDYGEDLISR